MLLHDDRLFSPDPAIRSIARGLYEEIKSLPILSPHGHVEAQLFAENKPFSDPTALLVTPDHYVFRLLYSQGVSLESLGIAPLSGGLEGVAQDPKESWAVFCSHYHLFAGTPTGMWLDAELALLFGVEERPSRENAEALFDQIQTQLQTEAFLPRRLFDSFGLEVLSTTNGATDPLHHHKELYKEGWFGKIRPCLRPDEVTHLLHPTWKQNIEALEELCGMDITSYSAFVEALENRRAFFKEMGAVSTDHGVTHTYTERLSVQKGDALFQRALRGEATAEDAYHFSAGMLMEMARMSVDDGLVMQLHPGSYRNHNRHVYEAFGPDKGGDIPIRMEFTQSLHALLNAYGNEPGWRFVVFTLDEATYARELAPLAGHYPAMRIGPAWWFHDSFQGMRRFREAIWETASIYNTVGFIDDTRALLSIPARHDVARRIDCDFLAELVARHIIDETQAHQMARALTYDLTQQTYNFPSSNP